MESLNKLTKVLCSMLVWIVVVAALIQPVSGAGNESLPDNATQTICVDGIILSAWRPLTDITMGQRLFRGFIYFVVMIYLFVGVSIASDRFMAGIEMITSLEREVKVKKRNGQSQIVVVRVWNETVANLTLMALGSSAPEILLSIIEIFGKNFEAGQLGPGTIVGSAAYNLFVIIALCIVIIPDGEVRRIKHLRVFFMTAFFSVFAYVWLYAILSFFSPGRVEIWEAALTFIFFPVTVLFAYIAERRLLVYKYLDKNYRMNKRGVVVSAEGVEEHLQLKGRDDEIRTIEEGNEDIPEEMREFEDARKEYINTIKQLRKQYPYNNLDQLEIMAMKHIIDKGYKSRAFYRIQTTRKILRSGDLLKKILQRAQNEMSAEVSGTGMIEGPKSQYYSEVYFDPAHYTVMEACGQVMIRVVRQGDLSETVKVDYETKDGSAETGSDYVGKKGTMTFPPGIDERKFRIQIIDDDLFEQDQHFYVRLSNCVGPAKLVTPNVATVMVLDDDHAGIFSFGVKDYKFVESIGVYTLRVHRYMGARGKVRLPYWTEDGTAKSGRDYEEQKGELFFDDNETEKVIQLGIVEEGSYEKDVLFYVNLGEPQMVEDDELAALIQAAEAKAPEDLTEEDKMALLGRPKAGDIVRAQLRIKESKEFKNTVDKLVQRANASLLIGTSSWKEQFTEALTVSPGGDDNEDYEEGEEPKPSCGDYIMHFLTLFWKLIFAFIPPTDISGGYLCFFVSIFCIGAVTAIIGDVASHFGCTLGIKDSVTAIVFVALGTSVPDTFASKVAAIQDKYADASVGNVTGSNAVNVFLGIGVAWTIAAIYHEINGTSFYVEPGNLAFSVTLFCSEALIAILVLLVRRSKAVGGELGGPKGIKYISGAILLGLWFIYLIMSTLEAYHIIPGF